MSRLEEAINELEALRSELAEVKNYDHPSRYDLPGCPHVHTQRCIPRHPREVAAEKQKLIQAITGKENAAVTLAWRAEIDATVGELMKADYCAQARFSRKAHFILAVWWRWTLADLARELKAAQAELKEFLLPWLCQAFIFPAWCKLLALIRWKTGKPRHQ